MSNVFQFQFSNFGTFNAQLLQFQAHDSTFAVSSPWFLQAMQKRRARFQQGHACCSVFKQGPCYFWRALVKIYHFQLVNDMAHWLHTPNMILPCQATGAAWWFELSLPSHMDGIQKWTCKLHPGSPPKDKGTIIKGSIIPTKGQRLWTKGVLQGIILVVNIIHSQFVNINPHK